MPGNIPTAIQGIRNDDIVIGFMGPTGAGKSYFIDLLTGQRGRRAGSTLKSVTSQVRATRVRHPNYGDRVVLVDTPGFDDTTMSDMQVLQMISRWLEKTYEKHVKLSGLIYLHRITDNRMAGSPYKNLRMFGEICGDVAMNQVILVSTMWENVRPDIGAAREVQLKENFWKPLIEKGSRVDRLETSNPVEAWRVVSQLIEERSEREAVLLQEELVELGVKLSETQAGKMLYSSLQRLLSDQKESLGILHEQIRRSNDPSAEKELKKEYAKIEEQFQKTFNEVKKLKIPLGRRIKLFFFGKKTRASSGRFGQSTERRGTSTPQSRLQSLIMDVVRNPKQREMVSTLVGDDAQHVAEYFNLVLHEFDIFGSDEGLYLLSSFSKLVKSAEVYPKCYLPKSVTRDTSPFTGGSFADIYRAKEKRQPLCLKVIRVFQKQENAQLLRAYAKEIVLWPRLSHRNILPFFGVYLLDEPSQRICFVSPWMENGNLLDYLRVHPETPRIPLLLDVTEGLEYIHKASIVHGDIKAQNVLVSDIGRALIADFGLSHVATGSKLTSTKLSSGTARWTAPEMLGPDSNRMPPTAESDIWSFACLCYEVLTGKAPFHQYSEDALISTLVEGKATPIRPPPEDIHATVDDTMWATMTKCWVYAPHMRPTCEDIRESITGLQVRDTRPENSTQMWDIAAKFRKAILDKSKAKVDYERVETILLRVQRAASSVPA